MEVTIDGRRYWKEGDQWYREILQGEELPMVTQILVGESWDWSTDYYHLDKEIREGLAEWLPRRDECDDPTAAKVVKEGDTVQTPMGPGKAVKAGQAAELPQSVFVDNSERHGETRVVSGHEGPVVVFVSVHDSAYEYRCKPDFIEAAHQECPKVGAMKPVVVKVKNGPSLQVRGSLDSINRSIDFARKIQRDWKKVKLWGVFHASELDEQAQMEDAKSRGGFAVALEDSQPDGGNHEAKASGVPTGVVCFPDFVFFYDQLESARQDASNPEFSIVTLKGGLTKKVKATCDEIARAIGEAAQAGAARTKTHAEQVAKTSTITLRDQFALAALPAVIEKFGLANAKDLATEVWYIADVMLTARGK